MANCGTCDSQLYCPSHRPNPYRPVSVDTDWAIDLDLDRIVVRAANGYPHIFYRNERATAIMLSFHEYQRLLRRDNDWRRLIGFIDELEGKRADRP